MRFRNRGDINTFITIVLTLFLGVMTIVLLGFAVYFYLEAGGSLSL